jgi:hypothetical protein
MFADDTLFGLPTKHLGSDASLLDRFFVFAEVRPGQCAAFDQREGTIWYEEDTKLHQTDFTLVEFIEASFREVAECERPA